jgi:hypothetical protein
MGLAAAAKSPRALQTIVQVRNDGYIACDILRFA